MEKIIEIRAIKRPLFSHEYHNKEMRGKKRSKQFCQKHTNSASKKCGKKSTGKSAKKRFLYSHEYRDPKRGEKVRNMFSKNTRIVRAKNVRKKM